LLLIFFTGIRLPLVKGYKITEAGSVLSVNTSDAWRAGTVGRFLAEVQVRLAENGEFPVQSPGTMAEYWNQDTDQNADLYQESEI